VEVIADLPLPIEKRFPKYGSRRVEKWVAPRWLKSVKTHFFIFIFQVLSILWWTELLHQTHFIWLRLIKTSGFPKVLMAAQLLAN